MNNTTVILTTVAVFGFAIVLAMPLGRIAGVKLKPGRYTQLDGMRAIAALMVVCSHYLIHARLITGEPIGSPLKEALGAVGVQIFFCITGFLFTRKAMYGPIDVPSLISSRVRRIVPLYLFCMTAGIALAAYIASSVPGAPPVVYQDVLRAYAYGFIGGNVPSIAGMPISGQIGQVWTLSWEWTFYLFVPFIAAVVTSRTWIVAALLFLGACALYQFQVSDQVWAFFLPGVVCGVIADKVKIGTAVSVLLFAAGVATFGASLWMDVTPYGITRLALCAIGFPCLLFGHQYALSIRPLRILGEVSYSIYMVHLIFASGFYFIVANNWDIFKTPEDKILFGLVALAGMLMFSFVTYALIERPFMKGAAIGSATPSSPALRAVDVGAGRVASADQ